MGKIKRGNTIIGLLIVMCFAFAGCQYTKGVTVGPNSIGYENDNIKGSVAKIDTGTTTTTHIRGIFEPKTGRNVKTDVWGTVTPLANGGKQIDVFAQVKE